MSAAVYRLDRTNTRAPGAVPGTIVLTGSQRSEGVELGVQGEIRTGWHLIGAMAFQTSEITSTTSAAPAGRVAPLVPRFSASLWNRWMISSRVDVALGAIHQDEQFASISNAVTLPRYSRVDAAIFYEVNDSTRVQLNIENLTNERYWFTAHNDDNITPGSGVLARLTVSTRF
jgi:catecholate siderophore receptor